MVLPLINDFRIKFPLNLERHAIEVYEPISVYFAIQHGPDRDLLATASLLEGMRAEELLAGR